VRLPLRLSAKKAACTEVSELAYSLTLHFQTPLEAMMSATGSVYRSVDDRDFLPSSFDLITLSEVTGNPNAGRPVAFTVPTHDFTYSGPSTCYATNMLALSAIKRVRDTLTVEIRINP
jgi:hypothetical protein